MAAQLVINETRVAHYSVIYVAFVMKGMLPKDILFDKVNTGICFVSFHFTSFVFFLIRKNNISQIVLVKRLHCLCFARLRSDSYVAFLPC